MSRRRAMMRSSESRGAVQHRTETGGHDQQHEEHADAAGEQATSTAPREARVVDERQVRGPEQGAGNRSEAADDRHREARADSTPDQGSCDDRPCWWNTYRPPASAAKKPDSANADSFARIGLIGVRLGGAFVVACRHEDAARPAPPQRADRAEREQEEDQNHEVEGVLRLKIELAEQFRAQDAFVRVGHQPREELVVQEERAGRQARMRASTPRGTNP